MQAPSIRGRLRHPVADATAVLREQRDAIVERTAAGLPGHRAVEWLRALGESLQTADVPNDKADLMHAIYERITVAGPRSWVSG